MKFLFIAVLLLLTTGCADSVSFASAESMVPVGFWYGLWHGWIFAISFICSIFMDDVAVYAIYNNGVWYDFGFFLGLGLLGGAGSSAT